MAAWMKIMIILAITDVLLAACLMTVYVILLSDHLAELQIVQWSKAYHLMVYLYVALCTMVQIVVAFKFYQALTLPKDDKEEVDLEDVLPITKLWVVASYLLLVNWALKAGIYAQRCKCGMSVALAVYLAEIAFRLCAICVGSAFLKKLEKVHAERKAQIKLEMVVSSFQAKGPHITEHYY